MKEGKEVTKERKVKDGRNEGRYLRKGVEGRNDSKKGRNT
jgi:hypothetical protein